ncbi:YciI family protein [Crassaminicella profunda]|uniref:YciI family protein n=1 Tax=Crassaminicella profunda TaxID=1286698 RepID=UPI001CA6BFD0|nr:YciI family protein [Crassaminicella profunda]QZY56467.1 YciI family protein [Crassaminicella profunda]
MKKGDKLFVRIDSKVEGTQTNSNDFNDHIKYLSKVASERYFIGGGFSNTVGGMIVFEAKDLVEAKEVADNDPLIKRSLYRYELFEWDLVILSEEIEKIGTFQDR